MASPIRMRGASGQRVEDDDEDQDDGDQHVVLQVGQQLVDEDRLVLRVGHLQVGQRLLALRHELLGDRLGALDRLDHICADALLDGDGDGRPAVDAGDRLGVLEGGPHGGEVANPDDGVRLGDDRQIGDVLGRLDQRGHLDRVFALGAFDGAGSDKAVRRADALDQLIELQAIGRQLHRIDDRLDEFVARTLDLGLRGRPALPRCGRAGSLPRPSSPVPGCRRTA